MFGTAKLRARISQLEKMNYDAEKSFDEARDRLKDERKTVDKLKNLLNKEVSDHTALQHDHASLKLQFDQNRSSNSKLIDDLDAIVRMLRIRYFSSTSKTAPAVDEVPNPWMSDTHNITQQVHLEAHMPVIAKRMKAEAGVSNVAMAA